MADTKKATRRAPTTPPLREVVGEHLRTIIARDQLKLGDIADSLGKSRPWLHRRTSGLGPITTDDIDDLARALGVSTDELTRRG